MELGLQSAHDATLRRIRRGHDFDTFCRGYRALSEAGIAVCVHVINGLPTEGGTIEDRAQMIETVSRLAALRPAFVKIHALHILRGTQMEQEYLRGEIRLLSMEEYVRLVCEQLTLLPPTTVVCRLTGDGAQDALIAPQWTKNKRAVLASIDRTLAREQRYQGMAFSDAPPTR